MGERSGVRKRSELCDASEGVSGASERTIGRSNWPSALRVDFMQFLPTVRPRRLKTTSAPQKTTISLERFPRNTFARGHVYVHVLREPCIN